MMPLCSREGRLEVRKKEMESGETPYTHMHILRFSNKLTHQQTPVLICYLSGETDDEQQAEGNEKERNK